MENNNIILLGITVHDYPTNDEATEFTPIINLDYCENKTEFYEYLTFDKKNLLKLIKGNKKHELIYSLEFLYNLKKENLVPSDFSTKSTILNKVLEAEKNLLVGLGYDVIDILNYFNIEDVDFNFNEIEKLLLEIEDLPNYVINSGIILASTMCDSKTLKGIFSPNSIIKYQEEYNVILTNEWLAEFCYFIRKKYSCKLLPLTNGIIETQFYEWFKHEIELMELNDKFALL
jgi:hypothetical protein